MADLEIIGTSHSNYVWVCRMAATEKGVPYKLVEVRPHTPDVDAIHPFGKIPVMRHGGISLFESKAICTYIDKAFQGPPLIPSDALAAALTEQWISSVNTTIDATWMRQYLVGYVFPGTPDRSPNRPKIDAALPAMAQQFPAIDRAVAKTGHLVGSSFTLADMNLLPIVFYMQRFPESQELLAAHRHLTAYLAHHLERPSVKSTIPPPPAKRT